MQTNTIYLLHFSRPLHHARHYLGSAIDVDARVAEHLAGHGSPLVAAAIAAGIGVQLVRTWPGGRNDERRLKDRHNTPRLCPLCRSDLEASQRDRLFADAVQHGLSVHEIARMLRCGAGEVRQALGRLKLAAPDWPASAPTRQLAGARRVA